MSALQKKIARIGRGQKPRVIDLFCGCGGISLGFKSAGFEIVGGIDLDPFAIKTHAANFFGDFDYATAHARPHDIVQISPSGFCAELGIGDVENACDVLVGGPPCQAYARVGRAKLREINEHPQAYRIDPRANLYLRYLEYVDQLSPLAILLENVPDMLNWGGHNIAEEISEVLKSKGFIVAYTLLNAANYGVPQLRERVFLIAYRRELCDEVVLPRPTHRIENLPVGYIGTRNAALKLIDTVRGTHYLPAPIAGDALPPAVTARQALADLPPITTHLSGALKRGARKFNELARYSSGGISGYARSIRNWADYESPEGVYDHVIRSLTRDAPIFARMKAGDEYPAAVRIAETILTETINELFDAGANLSATRLAKLRGEIVPPYPTGTFPNRWWKLDPDKPVRTLMAHLGKDTYSHIHYDDAQARVISVREAARLQSFPDGFKFAGAMNAAFRQVGNSVPPLLALRLAERIRATLIQSSKKPAYRKTLDTSPATLA